jgi:DUF971 family protein
VLPPEATEPTAITADRAARTLTVTWADGVTSEISFEALRWACPCAVCKGEGGQPGVLASTKRLTPEQTEMTDLRAVGLYAVSPLWADGHDTGIYPYNQLRQLGDSEARKRQGQSQGDVSAGDGR